MSASRRGTHKGVAALYGAHEIWYRQEPASTSGLGKDFRGSMPHPQAGASGSYRPTLELFGPLFGIEAQRRGLPAFFFYDMRAGSLPPTSRRLGERGESRLDIGIQVQAHASAFLNSPRL